MWIMFLIMAAQRSLGAMGRNARPQRPGAHWQNHQSKDGEQEASAVKKEDKSNSMNLGLLLYVLWTLLGTFFYAFHPGQNGLGPLGFIGGFFMAVNVGYSIGLNPPIVGYVPSLWFSSFYIIVGAFLITVSLAYIGERVAMDASENLLTDLQEREAYEERIAKDKPFYSRFKAFLEYNWAALASVGVWIFWMSLMVLYSMAGTVFKFPQAQYFAVSVSSSAGNFSLPPGSPEWLYGITGIAAAIGVPIMAMAISSLAMLLKGRGSGYFKVKQATSEPVSEKEIETLERFGLNHSNGVVSKEEYVLLCMMRMGTEPGMIQFICETYDKIERERGCVPLESALNRGRRSSMTATARCYVSSTEDALEGTARMRTLSTADLETMDGDETDAERMMRTLSQADLQMPEDAASPESVKSRKTAPGTPSLRRSSIGRSSSVASYMDRLDDHWSDRADDHSEVEIQSIPPPPDDDLDDIGLDLEAGYASDNEQSDGQEQTDRRDREPVPFGPGLNRPGCFLKGGRSPAISECHPISEEAGIMF